MEVYLSRYDLPRVVILLWLFSLSGASGQQSGLFEPGSWKAYYPADEYTQVLTGTQSVIIVNPFQLVLIYPESDEELVLYKGNGLSDVGISAVTYMMERDAIIVGYTNGNVDIVTPDRTFNIPGIKNNQNILASKRINDIAVSEDQVFLATDFGVVQIDAAIHEFESTLFTPDPVTQVEWLATDQSLFCATDTELYFLPVRGSTNLADINQWDIIPLGMDGIVQDADVWKDQLFVVAGEALWKWTEGALVEVEITVSRIRFIHPAKTHLVVVNEFSNIFIWDGKMAVQMINRCLIPLRDVVMWGPDTFWYVQRHAVGKFQNGECEPQNITGVPSQYVTEMAVMDGDLFVATGGVSRIYNNLFREDGFYTNTSGDWVSYNNSTVPELMSRDTRDIYQVVPVPARNQVFFGSFWSGVIQFEEGDITVFDQNNSSLDFSVTNPDRIRVADLFLDDRENLWVANHDAIKPLSVMTPDGDWHSFQINTGPRIEKLVVDEFQNIWMAIAERGLNIFRPNDWTNGSDDESRLIIPGPGDGSGTGFDNARINEIVLDHNGGVWLGTESGPVLFDCANQVFDEICQGRKPVIELNGQLNVLLRDENVKAIAIDGGNRKWFGTDNGVFVVSADLTAIDHHFKSENSPLPSNSIVDIAIDGASGEVFIATDEGLVSYRGEATTAAEGSMEGVVVYPNPVPPDYSGRIGIKNLPENALVRITTLSGRLIYENRALGGQMVWNRLDQDGRAMASGIYLVFVTQDKSLSPFTQMGKIFLLD